MLAGLADEGVPPQMLHCLALQMAGFGFGAPGSRFDVRGAATIPRPARPAASPSAVRSAIAELREAAGCTWSDAVGACLTGQSAEELMQARVGGSSLR